MDIFLAQLSDLAFILSRPFVAFLYEDSVLYWPYLLSAGVFAIGIPIITAGSSDGGARATLLSQFSTKIWWSPSSRADYRYYIINSFVFGFILAPLILAGADVGKWISTGLSATLGPINKPVFDAATLRITYTICFFIAYDFGRFLAHWSQHQVPLLWQFHKLHHSAEVLTPMTSYRVHPVDLLIMGTGGNLFGGLVTGIFFYIGAGEVTIFTLLGAHFLIGIYNMIGNLRHSHVWLDYGIVGYVLISPAQHQIHHSMEPHHIGKNVGFAFAFWDALFGTLYVPKGKETFRMGLGDDTDGDWHKVARMYWWPFKMAAKTISLRIKT